jgi:hypothetical protein
MKMATTHENNCKKVKSINGIEMRKKTRQVNFLIHNDTANIIAKITLGIYYSILLR